MPRPKRADEAGAIYHALNRGNARQTIFHKPEDYEAFLRVLGETLERYPAELFAFTLKPNHGHMVLRPAEDGGMGRMLRWATATHTQRYHAHYQTSEHLYQARFKSCFVADDGHEKELAEIGTCVQRGRPFGDEVRVREVAARAGPGHTLRSRGRPRNAPATGQK